MAGFLDVVYRSDEKDRVSTFLTVILNNVFPYLRVRMTSNSDRFLAASRLLASVSSYQYTRRSWRREVLDLLYEPVFFQMSPTVLQNWNVIIDNLMTQDKNTFKEALVRLTFSQPAGLNLFSNKEIEHDLRAACLKKLSYLVYASEADQYAKSMPDLLERLTECLRLGQGLIPQVHAQVFIFARTLLSRMSAVQLTSLWPIIIPEVIMVFKALANFLSLCSKQSNGKSVERKNDTKPPTAKELSMYLGACKFLATCLLLPEYKVPQFPFYRWIFVNDSLSFTGDTTISLKTPPDSSPQSFIPYVTEVTQLIQDSPLINQFKSVDRPNFSPVQGCLHILALDRLDQICELAPFLFSLEKKSDSTANLASSPTVENGVLLELALEAALAQEFPEPITSR
ncbi:Protein dopey-2 [Fasciola gigantica]|uniref:Protein dopey-2 n=1 Tax=Fasciola gigantica TaxID=46835 RepID=A0A504YIL9_FASGI|nr:Protein dopey-2 [Fasciola gigantica]